MTGRFVGVMIGGAGANSGVEGAPWMEAPRRRGADAEPPEKVMVSGAEASATLAGTATVAGRSICSCWKDVSPLCTGCPRFLADVVLTGTAFEMFAALIAAAAVLLWWAPGGGGRERRPERCWRCCNNVEGLLRGEREWGGGRALAWRNGRGEGGAGSE